MSDRSDTEKGDDMKHISVKMTDDEYEIMERRKGDKTTSEFIWNLIATYHEGAQITPEYFEKLFREVRYLTDTVSRFITMQKEG